MGTREVTTLLLSNLTASFLQELILRDDKGAGVPMNLLQNWVTSPKPRRVPFWVHGGLALLNTMANWLPIKALDYGISFGFSLVFRSSQLLITSLLGTLRGDRYTKHQWLGLMLVTCGLSWMTQAELQSSVHLAGLILLLAGTVGVAALGYVQQFVYATYTPTSNELLYYATLGQAIALLPITSLPTILQWKWQLWCLGGVNIMAQGIAVRGVHAVLAQRGPVVLTWLLTLRKFLSCLVQAWAFGYPWSPMQWIGTIAVFVGTFLYWTP